MNGSVGKILRVDLTRREISSIETAKYEQWGGGHGMGSAIFWDLCRDKTVSGFHPGNVITLMTSPLTGTLVPGAAGRTEIQAIGVQSSPIGWFTRSNFGGRFGTMLKFAGFDGVVVEGQADGPVWIDIRDGEAVLRDAGALWGKDTWDTQQEIHRLVSSPGTDGQNSAVLSIGPAGENLCRIASVIHDAGHGAGQGGFGAVFGAKRLKAISAVGKGSIQVADPAGLLQARTWTKQRFTFDIDDPEKVAELDDTALPMALGTPPVPAVFWRQPERSRPHACVSCPAGCRMRHAGGQGNESSCASTAFYSSFDGIRHSGIWMRILYGLLLRFGQRGAILGIHKKWGRNTSAAYRATDLAQKLGINTMELMQGLPYLYLLYKKGIIGPGKPIDTDLPFEEIGEYGFIEKFLRQIAYRQGFGGDLAGGFYRAAEKWGRLEEDLANGLLHYPYWGLPDHYDPRAQIEWGYGSVLADRDINEHDFVTTLHWLPSVALWSRKPPPLSAQELVETVASKLEPYQGDPLMVDYSTENIYSDHIVKLVAWHRHYGRFWKQSMLFCNYLFPDFYNPNTEDKKGMTGEGESRFVEAVTGRKIDFVEGMELGRKIWNLDNAIWTLQGRHRDMARFAPYIYDRPTRGDGSMTRYYLPGREKGEWKYIPCDRRHLDREAFEEWKTRYYRFEGWDPATGWPTRSTLEALRLGEVADELQRAGKLGREST